MVQKQDLDDLLKEYLAYDPLTGSLTWIKKPSKRVCVGAEAGIYRPNGHAQVTFKGKMFGKHRLIWFIHTGCWPESYVDHKDRNSKNDKWDNLRESSPSGNSQNTSSRKNSTSKYLGVCWNKKLSKWEVCANGKHIGFFTEEENAAKAYDTFAKERYGEFASLNFIED